MMKRQALATSFVALLTVLDGVAMAQTAPAPDAGTAQALPEVFVTATRRAQNLQDVPQAVSAISGDKLEALGVVQPEDLDKTVPGLALSPNGTQTQVYLRGVGTFAVNTFSDSAVAFNVDGVFMAFPAEIGGNFYDLQRVEVLKGPQGTLYGRNATAGAINLVPNHPDFTFGGEDSLEIGDYGLVRFSGDLNVPLSDQFATRLSAQIVHRDGYFTDGSGDDKSEAFRFQGLYKPDATLSVLFSADYLHTDDRGNPDVPLPAPDPNNPWLGPSTAASNIYLEQARTQGVPANHLPPGIPFPLVDDNSFEHADIYGLHAELTWDLGFGTLTVLPAYKHLWINSLVEPGFLAYVRSAGQQKSLEVRLASPVGGALDWIVGTYYFNDSITDGAPTLQGFNTIQQVTGDDDTSVAVFGDLTYKLTDEFKLTGGLRYTNEQRSQDGHGDIAQLFGPPIIYSDPGSVTFNNVSGKIGASYDLTPGSLVYVSADTGFKSGGFNPDIAPNTYAPEKLTAYSIGTKNSFLDHKLQANAELFYWDYKDHQEVVLAPLQAGGFAPQERNIGASTLKGGNIDLQYKITADDLLSAQVEYLSAVFDDFQFNLPALAHPAPGLSTTCSVTNLGPFGPFGPPPSHVDCSGKPFTRAPKWSAILSFQHSFHLENGASLVAGVHSELDTSSWLATDYIPSEKQPGFTRTDLDLGYHAPDDNWSLTGYIRNVENSAVYASAFEQPFIPGLAYATLRPPRTFGAVFKIYY